MSTYDDSDTQVSRTSIRKVRRIEEPNSPLFPMALLPLIGLLALTLYSCNRIQDKTENAAEEALSAANLDWVNAEARYRDVYLTGKAPDNASAQRAVRVVEASEATTWFGARFDPVHVYENFEITAASAPVSTATTAEPPPIVNVNGLSPDWTFRLFDGVLRLEGEVPNDEARQYIVAAAQASISLPRLKEVKDNLRPAARQTPEGYLEVASRGINTVRECDRGVASFRRERFSLTCELPKISEARVRTEATAPLPIGRLGSIEILANEDVTACEGSLAELLNNTKIEFATNSAQIDQSSEKHVESIANAAMQCPGTLRIEGHTDSTGSATSNQDLSARRAESVRAALVKYGVPANRLISRGYGSTQPIAPNTNSDGRARNRRIEIKVVRPDE